MTLDALGRQVSVTQANGGTLEYHYDLLGDLLSSTDADGNVTAYAYDLLNRKVSETLTPGGTALSRQYLYGGSRTAGRTLCGSCGFLGVPSGEQSRSRCGAPKSHKKSHNRKKPQNPN